MLGYIVLTLVISLVPAGEMGVDYGEWVHIVLQGKDLYHLQEEEDRSSINSISSSFPLPEGCGMGLKVPSF